MKTVAAVAFALVLAVTTGFARGGRSSGGRAASRARISHTHRVRTSVRCVGCTRDSHGRIKRSASARRQFQRSHRCPSTGKPSGGCPGYVIDHVQALKHGGADSPSNMQWQTKAEAKAKDKGE
jgi:hypothetical protein